MNRRALLSAGGSTVVAVAGAGCNGFTRSDAPKRLVLANEFRDRVTLDVRVEGESGTAFDRAVDLDPGTERTFEPFELDEQYGIYVTTPDDDVTVGELSEFGVKACGPNPTELWVEENGDLTGAIAGCGA